MPNGQFNFVEKKNMAKIKVENSEITVIQEAGVDFISLTDMASVKENQVRSADIIKNWLRTRYTLEFLGVWEQIHNPNLKWSNSTTLNLMLVCQVL